MIATAQLTIRHYMPGDIMRHLVPEYSQLEFDPDWCWVAEGGDGAIEAVALAAGANQTAVLLRIAALPGAPPTWLLALLRSMFHELGDRGYKIVVANLSATRAEELKLGRIFQRAGGKLTPTSGFIAVCAVVEAGRW